MKYELTQSEYDLIESYRNLFPEFQATVNDSLKELFALQTKIMKKLINGDLNNSK